MGADAAPDIPGYRVERVLGTGGMAVVYLAENLGQSRLEAVKVLSAEASADPAVRRRFERDVTTAGKLDHPNIAKVYGHGTTEAGQLWVATEYVATDAETALGKGAVTPALACRIVTEVAAALDYAHSRGVVHGNLKPSNFLLDDGGRVLLADFGSTPPATVDGMAYAAPELIQGKRPDARSDEYALGCSLFRLLAGGQYPFSTEGGIAAVERAHLDQPPPQLSKVAPWASPMLDVVFAAALAKSPQERYRSTGELAADATRAVDLPAPPPKPKNPPPPPPAEPVEAVKPPPAEPVAPRAEPVKPPPAEPAKRAPAPEPVDPSLPAWAQPVNPLPAWAQPVNPPPAWAEPVEPPRAEPVPPPPPARPKPVPPPPPARPTPVSRPPAPRPEPVNPPPPEPEVPFPAVPARKPFPRAALAAAAVAVALVAVGTLAWRGLSGPSTTAAESPSTTSSSPSPTTSTTTSSTPTPTPASAADVGHLTRLLPPGYPPGACVAAPKTTAAAEMACQGNTDLPVPSTATYTLARSPEAMRTEFDRLIGAPGTATVVCPGNIQSPGPWRRLTNPDQPVGTLWCGLRGERPVVAWTLDAEAFVATVESAEPGAMDQLYNWWASHS